MSLPPTPFAALLLATASTAFAGPQVQAKPDGRWRGHAGAALSLASGNTDSESLALDTDLARATAGHKLTLRATARHGRSKVAGVRRTDSSKWAGSAQMDWTLTPKTYAFANAALESDRLVALTLRSSAAGGLGYKLVDRPAVTFAVFGGAGASRDRYSQPQTIAGRSGERFSRVNLRLGEDFAWQLNPATKLEHGLEVDPGLSGDQATLARARASLAVAMNRTWNLTVGVTLEYNSQPPEGRKNNDLVLLTGLSVNLGDV